jgi:hypothetical protein
MHSSRHPQTLPRTATIESRLGMEYLLNLMPFSHQDRSFTWRVGLQFEEHGRIVALTDDLLYVEPHPNLQ